MWSFSFGVSLCLKRELHVSEKSTAELVEALTKASIQMSGKWRDISEV